MPATSTEMWSEQSSTKTSTGWNAQRGWLVTGAATDEEARTATPLDGRAIPAINASHSESAAMRVRDLPVSPGKGPNTRIVRAVYAIPESGSFPGGPGGDPLLAPAQYFIEHVASSEEAESEAPPGAMTLQNAAGDPFDPPLTRDVFDLQITITRNEPFFPLMKSLSFRNVVNNEAYTIPGVGYVPAGKLLCLPMRMGSPITESSTYTPVIYTLLAREDGWKWRVLNKGYQGWYMDGSTPKKGKIRDQDGVISQPVLLDRVGKPLLTSYTIANGSGAGVSAAANPSPLPVEYFASGSTSGAHFIEYRRFREVDFSTLL